MILATTCFSILNIHLPTVFGNKGVNTARSAFHVVWNKEPFAASNEVIQTRLCVYADVKGAKSDKTKHKKRGEKIVEKENEYLGIPCICAQIAPHPGG